ncbi:MAG: GNAT family N-acetyltransferase [Anaerolineales bacterium]
MTPHRWLIHLLKGSGFTESDRVVAFSLRPSRSKTSFERSSAISPISESDLSIIERLDQAAFVPPWQMDGGALRETWRRSIWASVCRREGRLAGYLMATPTPQGVHISRLAVHPEHQNKGIGRSLIGRLLEECRRRGIPQITVNTQLHNPHSHRLYRSLGFLEAGEHLPVFRFDIPRW